jgi:hypothetical protein
LEIGVKNRPACGIVIDYVGSTGESSNLGGKFEVGKIVHAEVFILKDYFDATSFIKDFMRSAFFIFSRRSSR